MAAPLSLSPLADDEWPPEIADLLGGFAGGLNVYRTMARRPELLRAWAPLREHVVNRTALGPVRAEMVILRAGWRLGSSYEWSQHILRARKVGLSDDDIRSLSGPLEDMSPECALFAGAVDALFDDRRLSPDQIAEVTEAAGVAGLFDLIATVGFYTTLGLILNTAETPLDDDAVADLAAKPLLR